MSKKSERKYLKCVESCNKKFAKSIHKKKDRVRKKIMKSRRSKYGGYKKSKSRPSKKSKRKSKRKSKSKSSKKLNKKQKGRGYSLGSNRCDFTMGSYPCVSKYSDC